MKAVFDDLELITLGDAARLWKCHPETLRRKVRTGELRAFRIGRHWCISAAAARNFLSTVESPAQNPEEIHA